MKVIAVKTKRVLPGSEDIFKLLDESLSEVSERSVVVITSKVISLCEGRTVPIDSTDKEALIVQEADQYYFTQKEAGHYNYHFTIVNNTLIPASGIDESNSQNHFILWPADPQATAKAIRQYLKNRFKLNEVGVLITDSTVLPSRWGTLGITIGYSGFLPVKDYIGTKDLFGRVLQVSKANIAGGLAAAAVLAMGEGKEQTPIAIIEDLPNVDFTNSDPSVEELAEYYISPLEDEPFAMFYNSVKWQKGGKKKA